MIQSLNCSVSGIAALHSITSDMHCGAGGKSASLTSVCKISDSRDAVRFKSSAFFTPPSSTRNRFLGSSNLGSLWELKTARSLALRSHSPQNSPHASTSESFVSITREENTSSSKENGSILSHQVLSVETTLSSITEEFFQEKKERGANGIASLEKESEILKVAVDVDEVLCSFLSTLNIFCAEKYEIVHELEEFFVYDFSKVWRCSPKEANDRVHAFFKSHHFNNGIPPIPGALDTLRRVSNYCELSIVTSRQHVIREPTMEWVEKHYPGVFKEVHFGNHFALEGVARPKSDICMELGAQILIDDNPKYAIECAQHGIHVLLFDWCHSYPWSKTKDGPCHPLITRVSDWREVETAILSHISATKKSQMC